MFETEDMLPRAAPKPTTSLGLNEPVMKPTVPEVSILFNQPSTAQISSTNNPTTQGNQPIQSYASWRKQVLPKVTYPPGADNDSATGCAVVQSNLYPLRNYVTATTSTHNINNNFDYNSKKATALEQRRSLESYAPVYSSAQISGVTAGSNPNLVQIQHQQEQQYMRRSLETLPVQRNIHTQPTASTKPEVPTMRPLSANEILTICAGTQTDAIGLQNQFHADIVTRKDYTELLGTIQEIRLEQQRLTEICSLLLEQTQVLQPSLAIKAKTFKDASTQYVEAAQVLCQQRPTVPDYHTAGQYVELHQAGPTNYRDNCSPNPQQQKKHQENQNFHTPQLRPSAHSTEYRPKTPLMNNNRQQQQHQLNQHQQNIVLPKPATEQSMVMNELALKYLPNDKLNEMLQDMNVSPLQQKVINDGATAIPLRNIENIDKGPNDMSNASYKYLKKYRLLSDEQQQQHLQQHHISPLLQRQQKQLFQREPSPLTEQTRAIQENLLDLDAIRRQPKFL